MDTTQNRRRIPNIQFRVLVVGRANAGKTSILQRVCETTESPTIYRGNKKFELNPTMERGEHCIDDALVFSNHTGYVFHDSEGIEAGDEEKLETLKEFIQRKCGEKRLRDKLHAIWYCVPMDDHRPGLNLKFYKDICPDQNVPVIAVFTKYDQFRRNVEMDVWDDPDKSSDSNVAEIAEKKFQDQYLHPLGDNVKYVRLEKMHLKNSHCDSLVEKTAEALNEDAVALMLLAVQKGNLELGVKMALRRVHHLPVFNVKDAIQECLFAFPYIWFWSSLDEFGEKWFREEWESHWYRDDRRLNQHTEYIMSLPAIQNLANNCLSNHHFIIAVILILKHATFLRLSNSQEAALTQAGLDYQESNIDLKIQEYLKTFSYEDVNQFAGFIKATEIVSS